MAVVSREAAEVTCQQDACEDAGLLQPSPEPSRCRRATCAATPSALAMFGLSLGLCLWAFPQQQPLPELAGSPPVSLEELQPQPQPHLPPTPLPRHTAVSASDDGTIKVWNLASGQCLRTLNVGGQGGWEVTAMAVDFARQRVVSGDEYGSLDVWDLASGQRLTAQRMTHKSDKPVLHVAVDFARQRAISSSISSMYSALKVWDLATGQCLKTLCCHLMTVSAVFADFSRQRAISTTSSGMRIWDLASGHCLKSLAANKVAVDFAFQRAVFANRVLGSLEVWDMTSGQRLRKLQGHKGSVVALAVDFSRQRAFSTSRDHTLKVWDLTSGQCLRTLRQKSGIADQAAVSFVRQRAIVTSECTGTLKVWNLATGQCLRTLEPGHRSTISDMAVDFVQQRAVSASGRTLKVWNLATGQCLRTLRGHKEFVSAVAMQTEEPFKFDCLAGAETSWLPRQLVNLMPWEKREYSEELVSKATLATGSWGSHSSQKSQRSVSAVQHRARRLTGEARGAARAARGQEEVAAEAAGGANVSAIHHSVRRLAREASTAARAAGMQAAEAAGSSESAAELFGGAGAAAACSLTGPEGEALAPLCAGLGHEAGKQLAELFGAKGDEEYTKEEEATGSREEGYRTSSRSVTGQSKRCTRSLQAKDEPVHYQAWQRRISLTYTHQIYPGVNRSITIDLDIPGVDLAPTGHTPGKEYGTLPKAPESGCYSKRATDTISAIIKGSCV